MRVLAIESSCDESAVAVLDGERGLLAHELYSQVELHRAYGGVVPELASRDHVRRLLPLVRLALEHAGSTPGDIDGVAYTAGPGLIGALLTGASLAASLAYAWGVPAIGVHHLEGHLLAPLLEDEPPPFPHVALLVSGGHTLLIEVGGVGRYRVLGASRDDAAGEAFDKSAKLLGLPYPGGPQLAQLAAGGRPGGVHVPAPDARPARTRVQLLGAEDRGAARGARRAPWTSRRGRIWRAAWRRPSSTRSSPRRCARSSTPASRCWWCRAASAPTRACASS